MASWTGKKNNVFYTRPEEPSFLKQFKERVGYKEDPGVKAKFESMPKATSEDFEDGDDEQPQIVQLQPGDLSDKDYEILKAKGEIPDSNKSVVTSDGRIKFNKPTKRQNDTSELKPSSKKLKDQDPKKEEKQPFEKKKKKKDKSANRKLLSFDDEDDP